MSDEAERELKVCPLCGADVFQETGFADNFGNGRYLYAACTECSYQSDWADHIRTRPTDDLAVALANDICREVAELPDRTSPDDWPEAMLVTHDELDEIVRAALSKLTGASE